MRVASYVSVRVAGCVAALTLTAAVAFAQQSVKVFISVDMEGIGGIDTPAMTNATGKDYQTGRGLMTDEVNAVVAAIFARGPAQVLVNDSHGDMRISFTPSSIRA